MNTSLAAMMAAAALCVGCAGVRVEVQKPLPPHDYQQCVEAALRGDVDGDMLVDAFFHFEARCSDGDTSACSTLGIMYERGMAVPQNTQHAATLYQRACAGNNSAGCTNLALLALNKGEAAERARAVNMLHESCHDGDTRACTELGKIYVRGTRAPRDVRLGSQLLERACNHDAANACFELARLHETKQVKRNIELEKDLFARACSHGINDGCERLAHNYPSAADAHNH